MTRAGKAGTNGEPRRCAPWKVEREVVGHGAP